MNAFRPTKARLELLQAVTDGAVRRDYDIGAGWVDEWENIDRKPRFVRVDHRIHQMEAAGWVQLRSPPLSRYERLPRLWTLTPVGRTVLENGGGRP